MPAKPMGIALREIQRGIIEKKAITFDGVRYNFDEMTTEELEELVNSIRLKGRQEHRPRRVGKLWGHNLRKTQSAAIAAIIRERKEQEI
jgi:hypothetical protein